MADHKFTQYLPCSAPMPDGKKSTVEECDSKYGGQYPSVVPLPAEHHTAVMDRVERIKYRLGHDMRDLTELFYFTQEIVTMRSPSYHVSRTRASHPETRRWCSICEHVGSLSMVSNDAAGPLLLRDELNVLHARVQDISTRNQSEHDHTLSRGWKFNGEIYRISARCCRKFPRIHGRESRIGYGKELGPYPGERHIGLSASCRRRRPDSLHRDYPI